MAVRRSYRPYQIVDQLLSRFGEPGPCTRQALVPYVERVINVAAAFSAGTSGTRWIAASRSTFPQRSRAVPTLAEQGAAVTKHSFDLRDHRLHLRVTGNEGSVEECTAYPG